MIRNPSFSPDDAGIAVEKAEISAIMNAGRMTVPSSWFSLRRT